MNGTRDVEDDAVWTKYLEDFETYNLSRVTVSYTHLDVYKRQVVSCARAMTSAR